MNRDLVVRCQGSRHRVCLARGLRFWRRARCPLCPSWVDPTRTRRILAWIANFTRPASRGWLELGVWGASVGYLILVLFAALALWGFSDRWWPATILLFGPRWVLSLPLLLLIPAALLLDRPLVWPLALAGVVLVGPVMGLRTGWPALLPQEPALETVKVASLNARGGNFLMFRAEDLLLEWEADIAVFQECGGALAEGLEDLAERFGASAQALEDLPGGSETPSQGLEDMSEGPGDLAQGLEALPEWHVDVRSSLCLASRFEILDVVEMDREALEFAGGSGLVVTYTLDLDGTPVHVTNLHLETPRDGFELIRAGRIFQGIPKIQEKSTLRDIELRRARWWTEQHEGPQLVAGDFNTPPESRAYRAAWGDWTNAFTWMGRGLGGTRLNGWIRARIDHVVADEDWTVVKARVGLEVGSDHLPVIAELRLR